MAWPDSSSVPRTAPPDTREGEVGMGGEGRGGEREEN